MEIELLKITKKFLIAQEITLSFKVNPFSFDTVLSHLAVEKLRERLREFELLCSAKEAIKYFNFVQQ